MSNDIQQTSELVSKLKLLTSSLQQSVLQQLEKLEDDVKNPALQKVKHSIKALEEPEIQYFF